MCASSPLIVRHVVYDAILEFSERTIRFANGLTRRWLPGVHTHARSRETAGVIHPSKYPRLMRPVWNG